MIPAAVVEVGFGATWQTPDESITWEDLTELVRHVDGITADRGRQSPTEQSSAGQLSLVLMDPDRRFDPFNQASPYAGLLVPGVPIAVSSSASVEVEIFDRVTETGDERVTEDGQARVLEPVPAPMVVWRGFVTGWPRRYDEGVDAPLVPLTCYDGTDRLTRAQLPASVVEIATMASQPVLYWPLTDSVGTEAVELIRGADGIYHQDIAGTRGALLPYAPAQAMKGSQPTPANPLGQRMIRPQALSLTDTVTIRCWFQFTEVPEDGAASLMLLQRPDEPTTLSNSGEPGLGVGIGMGFMVGWIGGQNIGAGAALFTSLTGPAATAGTDRDTHHLVCTVDTTTDTLEVWIDGQNLTLTTPVEGVDMAAVLAAVRLAGAGWGVSVSSSESAPLAGRPIVGHFAIWDRVLTPEEIEADYLAGVDPWGGDRPGERIGKVLDLVGWPVERRNIAQGYHQLGPASWDAGSSPIEHLRLVEATETGRLFVDRHGDVAFQDWLWSFVEEADPAITLGDGTPFIDVAVDLDDEWVRNIVSLSVQGGGTVTASDEISIESFGAVSLSREVAPRSVASARWAAAWLLDLWRNPQPRVPSIDIDLSTLDIDDQITVLGADLGTRIRLHLVERTGDPTHLDLIIEGVEHTVRADEWMVRWFVAPAPAVEPFLPDLNPDTLTVPAYGDGHVIVEAADYADARAGDGASEVDDSSRALIVGQAEVDSDVVVSQALVEFDVSRWRAIPGDLNLFFAGVELSVTPTQVEQAIPPTLNSGSWVSLAASYSTARAGAAMTGVTPDPLGVGQYWSPGPLYTVQEALVEFDLGLLPPLEIADVQLLGTVTNVDRDTAFTVEARAFDYGDSIVPTDDWVPGANLGALTLLASVAAPATPGPITFSLESAMATAIDSARAGTGKLRMVLASSRTRTGSAPNSGATHELLYLAGKGSGADALRLQVTAAGSDQTFTIEARLAPWDSPLTDSDFVAGADLAALPLMASREIDDDPAWVFDSEPGLLDAVQAAVTNGEPLGLLLHSSHQRTGTPPDTHDLVAIQSVEAGTGAMRLRLIPKED